MKKYSCFVLTQITSLISPSRPTRGAYRDRHGRGAGCGGRGSAIDEQRLSGRRSRVVLTPRRWCQVGGVFRSTTVARKPGHRGSTKQTVKTIARGKPDDSGVPVVTTRVLSTNAHEAAGALDTRLSLRSLLSKGQCSCFSSGASRREIADVCFLKLFEI